MHQLRAELAQARRKTRKSSNLRKISFEMKCNSQLLEPGEILRRRPASDAPSSSSSNSSRWARAKGGPIPRRPRVIHGVRRQKGQSPTSLSASFTLQTRTVRRCALLSTCHRVSLNTSARVSVPPVSSCTRNKQAPCAEIVSSRLVVEKWRLRYGPKKQTRTRRSNRDG